MSDGDDRQVPPPGPLELSGELPRFVELLRMSHGPVAAGTRHCGLVLEVEELEEPLDPAGEGPALPVRAIYRCRGCGRLFWGRWA